jgi:predicted ATPase
MELKSKSAMITKLKISNFKSHKSSEINTGALTLLTGINSSGKSSIIQSLLLLRQSFKKGRLKTGLDLNVPLCDIGKGIDALYRFSSESEVISFDIEINKKDSYSFNFNVNGKYDDTFLPLESKIDLNGKLLQLPLFTNNFQYLSAARWAGIDSYPLDSYAVETEKQLSLNYGQGELVAHFLEYYGDNREFEIKSELLLHPEVKSKRLLEQTIAWEREISPRLTMVPIKKGDKVTIEYGYKGAGTNPPTKNLQAKNVGFGISYSLSIIVALLSAEPGSLIIVENPEAHLHPKGQSKLAELIALAAKDGIQVFVETHSDHIFNGVRKAVAAGDIQKENVKIHFFELDDTNTSVGTEVNLSDKGRVLNYKKGLFDQFDDDLDALLGL